MSHGKLLILGTSDFVKKQFGVGYHLILTSKKGQEEEFNRQAGFLKQAVLNSIKTASLDHRTQDHTLKFILPFNEQQHYTALFQVLEEQLHYLQINLEMNSLEEAFTNIDNY